MIERKIYLDKIKSFIGLDVIKVITGFRCSGKSVLLNKIIILINNQNTIYINFEDLLLLEFKNHLKLKEYLESKINKNKKTYIFLNEIEEVEMFELVISSLKKVWCGYLYHRIKFQSIKWWTSNLYCW